MSEVAIWSAVAAGGALGALVRGSANRWLHTRATLFVNVIGSCLLGALVVIYAETSPDDPMRMLWMTGFCGSLTTFSTFCVDALGLARKRERGRLVAYLLATGILCLLAFVAGLSIGQLFFAAEVAAESAAA